MKVEIGKPNGLQRVLPFIASTLCTLALLLIIPMTQWIANADNLSKEPGRTHSVTIMPPPFLDVPEKEEEKEEIEEDIELEKEQQLLSLDQLNIVINAGDGGGFALGGDLNFNMMSDGNGSGTNLVFEVNDLDELPRPVRQVKMNPPSEFIRERRDGLVKLEILIDEQGKTRVLKVVDSSSPNLDYSAIEAAEQWLWTPPKKNGKSVRARYILPIGFKF